MIETTKANVRTAKTKVKKGTSDPRQFYLLVYNVLSCLAWLLILNSLTSHMLRSSSSFSILPNRWGSLSSTIINRASTAHAAIGFWVKWIQTAAILEPIHVSAGLVHTSFPITSAQVFSRLTLVWGILEQFPATQASPFFASMVFAWSMTEIIRYATYTSSILGVKLQTLDWLRYNLFYLLYPLGAGSEWLIMYSALPYARTKFDHYGFWPLLTFCGIWPLALIFLMLHMHQQRSKHLSGNSAPVKTKRKKRS